MKTIAIIGGTGLTEFAELTNVKCHAQDSSLLDLGLGSPSSDITEAIFNGTRLLFLSRHGHPRALPPHKINYRANLLALQALGANEIIAVNAVGGISTHAEAGHLVVPDQLIDYTHGRDNTFFDGVFRPLDHVEFSYPYDEDLRQRIITALDTLNFPLGYSQRGVYGVTQGPRLETIAEIKRLEQEGCDVVGMTGMPEAVLARELKIPYASVCLVVNPAAGKTSQEIALAEIHAVLTQGMVEIKQLIFQVCAISNP